MNKLDLAFKIIWGLALTLFIFIVFVILTSSWSETKNLLVPLGVLISAMLASVSLMKSIENTNKIEKEKIKRELFDRRKKIIFSILNLQVRLESFSKGKHLLESSYLHEYIDIIKDSYFIFGTKESRIIDPIFKKLMNLHNHIIDIERSNNEISKEANTVKKDFKIIDSTTNENHPLFIKNQEAKTISIDLLKSIKPNLELLTDSIKII